jgi:hypothetical protein
LEPGFTASIDWSTGWRLPLVDESKADVGSDIAGWEGPDENGYHNYDYGYNMVNSEMGYLYYEDLGNTGYMATDGSHPQNEGLHNVGDFEHLNNGEYWSGTEYSPNTDFAWFYIHWWGLQAWNDKPNDDSAAIAVRPGQVSGPGIPSTVPIPAAVWLIGSGLIGLVGIKRRLHK